MNYHQKYASQIWIQIFRLNNNGYRFYIESNTKPCNIYKKDKDMLVFVFRNAYLHHILLVF